MTTETFLTVRINDRCQPIDRGDYEDPLDDALIEKKLGEVTGGGTQLGEDGVIEYCELEVLIKGDLDEAKQLIKETLENNGLPKGSKILGHGNDEDMPIGNHDVMAVHFDNVGLPDSVYDDYDINDVLDEIESLLSGKGRRNSHAIIKDESVVYYGGESFSIMKAAIEDYFQNQPLCENGRITQAA